MKRELPSWEYSLFLSLCDDKVVIEGKEINRFLLDAVLPKLFLLNLQPHQSSLPLKLAAC